MSLITTGKSNTLLQFASKSLSPHVPYCKGLQQLQPTYMLSKFSKCCLQMSHESPGNAEKETVFSRQIWNVLLTLKGELEQIHITFSHVDGVLLKMLGTFCS